MCPMIFDLQTSYQSTFFFISARLYCAWTCHQPCLQQNWKMWNSATCPLFVKGRHSICNPAGLLWMPIWTVSILRFNRPRLNLSVNTNFLWISYSIVYVPPLWTERLCEYWRFNPAVHLSTVTFHYKVPMYGPQRLRQGPYNSSPT